MADDRKYGCLLFLFPSSFVEQVKKLAAEIADDDLTDKGREEHPHVTLLYGLHDSVTFDMAKAALEDTHAFIVSPGNVSVFPSSETQSEYDVVKIAVESDELKNLHERLKSSLPNTQTHPTYKPHITLAYVKPGRAEKYTDIFANLRPLYVHTICFSDAERNKDYIYLPSPPAKRLWVYACPECNGAAHNGNASLGMTFRGSAKCSSCEHSFPVIGKTPISKDGPELSQSYFASDHWKDQPRGQPENKGQFASGTSSKSADAANERKISGKPPLVWTQPQKQEPSPPTDAMGRAEAKIKAIVDNVKDFVALVSNSYKDFASGGKFHAPLVGNVTDPAEASQSLNLRLDRSLEKLDRPLEDRKVLRKRFSEATKRIPESARIALANRLNGIHWYSLRSAESNQPLVVRALTKVVRSVSDFFGKDVPADMTFVVRGGSLQRQDDLHVVGYESKGLAHEGFGAMLHGLWHILDKPVDERNSGKYSRGRISDSEVWNRAWKKEIVGGALSEHANISPQDGFAEFGRALGTIPWEMMQKFPKCCLVVFEHYPDFPEYIRKNAPPLPKNWTQPGRFPKDNWMFEVFSSDHWKDQPRDKGKFAATPRSSSATVRTFARIKVTKEVHEELERRWGKSLSDHDLAALAGSQENAKVSVRWLPRAKQVEISTDHDDYMTLRIIRVGPSLAESSIYNESIHVKKKGGGTGTRVLADQVEHAVKLGFKSIDCYAAGDAGSKYNGYYTWPRLGYDGPIDPSQSQKLAPKFRKARTLHELFAIPGGPEEWEAKGSGFNAVFDLSEGSRSRAILRAYARAKGLDPNFSENIILTGDVLDEEDLEILSRIWAHIQEHGWESLDSAEFADDHWRNQPRNAAGMWSKMAGSIFGGKKSEDEKTKKWQPTHDEPSPATRERRQRQRNEVFDKVRNAVKDVRDPLDRENHRRRFEETFDRLSPDMQDAICKNLRNVQYCNDEAEIKREYFRHEPYGGIGHIASISGFVSHNPDNSVDLVLGSLHDVPRNAQMGVLVHELFHIVDNLVFKDGVPQGRIYSGTANWKHAWNAEINTSEMPLTAYAARNAAEGWAEFGRLIVMRPGYAKRAFPRCWNIASSYIKDLEDQYGGHDMEYEEEIFSEDCEFTEKWPKGTVINGVRVGGRWKPKDGGAVPDSSPPKTPRTFRSVVIHPDAKAKLKTYLGREVKDDEIALLAGSLDNGHVGIGLDERSGEIRIYASGEHWEMKRNLHMGPDRSKWFIENKHFGVDLWRRDRGMGTRMLASQVEQAVKLGFKKIKCYAKGSPGSKFWNGYYTWPRLGFDADLEHSHQKNLTPPFNKAKTISELFAMPGGVAEWKKNGGPIYAEFDLSENSRSRAILRAYAKAKGVEAEFATSDGAFLSEEDDAILDAIWDFIAEHGYEALDTAEFAKHSLRWPPGTKINGVAVGGKFKPKDGTSSPTRMRSREELQKEHPPVADMHVDEYLSVFPTGKNAMAEIVIRMNHRYAVEESLLAGKPLSPRAALSYPDLKGSGSSFEKLSEGKKKQAVADAIRRILKESGKTELLEIPDVFDTLSMDFPDISRDEFNLYLRKLHKDGLLTLRRKSSVTDDLISGIWTPSGQYVSVKPSPGFASPDDRSFLERLAESARKVMGGSNRAENLRSNRFKDFHVDNSAARVIKNRFGRDLTDDEIGRLAGSADNATVRVSSLGSASVEILAEGDGWESRRTLQIGHDKRGWEISNDFIKVTDRQKVSAGFGTRMLADQVGEAVKHGFTRIRTFAAGSGQDPDGFNGYYTWPRLGYDGELDIYNKRYLAESFKNAKTLHELFAIPGGPEEWKKNGMGVNVVFDLSEGSNHRALLRAYARKKGLHPTFAADMLPGLPDNLTPEDEEILASIWEQVQKHGWESLDDAEFFDENQSRDSHGRWISSGSSIKKSAKSADAAVASSMVSPASLSSRRVSISSRARAEIKKSLGEHVTDDEVAQLAGALPGGRVSVSFDQPGEVQVEASGKGWFAQRTIYLGSSPQDCYIGNESFDVDEELQGSGIGTKMLTTQVAQARALGFGKIVTQADGDARDARGKKKPTSGYYSWARLGYDGPIRPEIAARLKEPYSSAKTIHELFAMKGGDKEWQKNGAAFKGTFDLSDSSRSMAILRAYARAKGIEAEFAAAFLNGIMSEEDEEILAAIWEHIQEHGWESLDTAEFASDHWKKQPRGQPKNKGQFAKKTDAPVVPEQIPDEEKPGIWKRTVQKVKDFAYDIAEWKQHTLRKIRDIKHADEVVEECVEIGMENIVDADFPGFEKYEAKDRGEISAKRFISAYRTFPGFLRTRIAEVLTGVMFYNTHRELHLSAGGTKEDFDRGYRVGAFVNWWPWGQAQVNLMADIKLATPEKTREFNEKIYGANAHEIWHLVDRTNPPAMGGRFRYSGTSDWRNAWKAEITQPGSPLSKYAESNDFEGFAEYGRLVATKPKEARTKFPKCWAAFSKMFPGFHDHYKNKEDTVTFDDSWEDIPRSPAGNSTGGQWVKQIKGSAAHQRLAEINKRKKEIEELKKNQLGPDGRFGSQWAKDAVAISGKEPGKPADKKPELIKAEPVAKPPREEPAKKVPPELQKKIDDLTKRKNAIIEKARSKVFAKFGPALQNIKDVKIRQAMHKQLDAQFNSMPIAAKIRLSAVMTGAKLFSTNKELNDFYASESLPGSKKKEVSGYVGHKDGGNIIHLALHTKKDYPSQSQEWIDNYNGQTIAHEMWHLIDGCNCQNPGNHLKTSAISDDPAWKSAWKSEINQPNNPITKYATANEREGLAEFGALVSYNPAVAEKKFPKCWKIFQKHMPGFQQDAGGKKDTGHVVYSSDPIFSFDRNQPRDEHGRWTDFAGIDIKPETLQHIRTTMKRDDITADDLARLAGTLKGGKVRIAMQYGTISISAEGDGWTADRTIHINDDPPWIANNDFDVREDLHGQGIGTQMLSTQVSQAVKLGFDRIETNAAGKGLDRGRQKYVVGGYYSWAKLGYDGQILYTRLDPPFDKAKTIHELFAMPGGPEHWRQRGAGFRGTFDLKAGSRSRAILRAYAQAKGINVDFADEKFVDPILSDDDEAILDQIWKQIQEKGWESLPKESREENGNRAEFHEGHSHGDEDHWKEQPRAKDGKWAKVGDFVSRLVEKVTDAFKTADMPRTKPGRPRKRPPAPEEDEPTEADEAARAERMTKAPYTVKQAMKKLERGIEKSSLSPKQKKLYRKSLQEILFRLSPPVAGLFHMHLAQVIMHVDGESLNKAWVDGGGKKLVGMPTAMVTSDDADPHHQDMHLDGVNPPPGYTPHMWRAHIYSHEMWHIIDGSNYHPETMSKSDAWKQAWAEEICAAGNPLSEYATESAREGFAEFGRMLTMNPQYAKRLFPKCYEFVNSTLRRRGIALEPRTQREHPEEAIFTDQWPAGTKIDGVSVGGRFKPGKTTATLTPTQKVVHERFATGVKKSALAPPARKVVQKICRTIAARMSEKATERFSRNIENVHFYADHAEMKAAFVKSGGKTDFQLGAFTEIDVETSKVVMHLGVAEAIPGMTTEETQSHFYSHEVWHVIDGSPLKNSCYSRTSRWSSAWNEEIRQPHSPLTRYATKSQREGFAEFGRLVFMEPQKAKSAFPRCWKFFAESGLIKE